MADLAKANDAGFDEKVLKADGPVLVDFFGTWCGPCQKMKPVLEEIATDLSGKLTVVQVEVSEAPETAGRYDVMSVPTLVLFVSGEPRQTLVGALPKAGRVFFRRVEYPFRKTMIKIEETGCLDSYCAERLAEGK